MSVYYITGGSGFYGINMVRYLLAQGHKVKVIDKEPFLYPELSRIEFHRGDIRDLDVVRKSMAGADVVIHAAAALPLYTKSEILSTDVTGTQNVLAAAYGHGVKRFIHISSTAVYGIPDHHPLLETDILQGVGPYGEAKILAEQACQEYRAKGMCVSVLRPKSFVGPERLGVFGLFYDWAKDGKNFPMIGSGNNRYQLLDVEDLCAATYLCATVEQAAVNTVFNIGARDYTTMKEDYQAVLDRAGFGKKVIGLPALPIIMILRILDILKLSPLYKWVYETAAKDSFVSIDRAVTQLGYSPIYSNKQALVRNYEWYLQNVQSFEGQTGVTHRLPWKQGALKIAKYFF